MNQQTLFMLRTILGVLGLALAGTGMGLRAAGKPGGTVVWVGIALVFMAAIIKGTQKK